MYTYNVSRSYPTHFPVPILPSSPFFMFFFFNNLLSLSFAYHVGRGVMSFTKTWQPISGHTSKEKNPLHQLLSMVSSSSARGITSWVSLLFMTGLILCGSCAGNRTYCDFMGAMSVPCSEDCIPQCSSPTSGSYILSTLTLVIFPGPWQGGHVYRSPM